MALLNGHTKGKLMKKFGGLGPYIREEQCNDGHYFFDCLAVCVNAKIAPEKREFWGWWMELEGQENYFTYTCQYGLFDKEGNWQVMIFKDPAVTEQVTKTQHDFYQRLHETLTMLDLDLRPAVE